MNKIIIACSHPDISEDFLFFNDDHFLTKPIIASKLPYYYDKGIANVYDRYRKNGHYKRALFNTMMALAKRNLPLKYFDVHTPIIYNKNLFPEVINQVDWSIKDGYVVKSLYCNSLQIEGTIFEDCKISHDVTESQLLEFINNRFVFSIDDQAINESFRKVMREFYGCEFPIKSEVSETIEN